MPVLNGRSYDFDDLLDAGYAQKGVSGEVLFPDQMLSDVKTEMAGSLTCQSVAPGAAGGVMASNVSAWVRSTLPSLDGVKFPAAQVASADVNTLDDYEEGSFTPGLAFGGASVGMSFLLRGGRYTKIGRLVKFRAVVFLFAKGSSTGAATITSLPFTIGADSALDILITGTTGVSTQVLARAIAGGTSISLYQYVANAAGVMNDSVFTNSTGITVTGSYSV